MKVASCVGVFMINMLGFCGWIYGWKDGQGLFYLESPPPPFQPSWLGGKHFPRRKKCKGGGGGKGRGSMPHFIFTEQGEKRHLEGLRGPLCRLPGPLPRHLACCRVSGLTALPVCDSKMRWPVSGFSTSGHIWVWVKIKPPGDRSL